MILEIHPCTALMLRRCILRARTGQQGAKPAYDETNVQNADRQPWPACSSCSLYIVAAITLPDFLPPMHWSLQALYWCVAGLLWVIADTLADDVGGRAALMSFTAPPFFCNITATSRA